MKTNIEISIRIASIFIVAIFFSLIGDYLHGFLGDWHCDGAIEDATGNVIGCQESYRHSPTWHWGYRHFLLCAMGISIFIYQIITALSFIFKKHNVEI